MDEHENCMKRTKFVKGRRSPQRLILFNFQIAPGLHVVWVHYTHVPMRYTCSGERRGHDTKYTENTQLTIPILDTMYSYTACTVHCVQLYSVYSVYRQSVPCIRIKSTWT